MDLDGRGNRVKEHAVSILYPDPFGREGKSVCVIGKPHVDDEVNKEEEEQVMKRARRSGDSDGGGGGGNRVPVQLFFAYGFCLTEGDLRRSLQGVASESECELTDDNDISTTNQPFNERR